MSQDRPDILVLPPVVFGAALLLALILEWILPLGLLPRPLATATLLPGLGLIVVGLMVGGWGFRTFRREGTNVNPHRSALHLVETGPFRYMRNPMYLGMVLMILGIGLAASLDWAVLFVPVVWAMLHYGVVLREEAYLRRKFGAPYEAWIGRTRRWI